MKFIPGMMTVALLLTPATATWAQDAAASPEVAPEATTIAPAPITSEEIRKFAKAAIEINRIIEDATVTEADKQARMATAVEQAGLDPQRYNDIALATQNDPAVLKQYEEAVTAQPQP